MKILSKNINKTYINVSLLGKSLKLDVKYKNTQFVEINQKQDRIELCLPKKYKFLKNINIINMAIEKMYEEIAEKEISNSMEKIRIILGFAPEDYKIKKMENDFYKCTNNKKIIINPEIVKYSRAVIDTTLIQAFCQLKYKVNTNNYKKELLNNIEKYENFKYTNIKFISQMKKIS